QHKKTYRKFSLYILARSSDNRRKLKSGGHVMRKTILPAIFFLLILIVTACQEEDAQPAPEPQPEEAVETVKSPEPRVAEFIELWKAGDFAGMHTNYLNQGTQSVYGEENFVVWQRRLHEQLGIGNLEISYTKPEEDAEWTQEQP